jgi:4-amino-4-deoxy-L-arabinose transferase-like glycosyltransferase
LVAVVLLAGALRFANLRTLGYANTYYTAAVTAMLKSWHNFFFVAAEPGGSVSVDKPPVGFWLQTASAFVFGVNTFGILLPQLLAGMASVIVLYHLVQRRFGQVAGLLAALSLAITPVVVATDRNNTIDSTLVLTLLLAAWAFIEATESARLRYLLLGAGLVGIGFNIKMLEAYLPLPAFYALYFLGSDERLLRKIGKLALATVLLLVISASWITVVDMTPADQRPYVGSSGTNSAWNLAIGYNGIQRLVGMRRNASSLSSTLLSLFRGESGSPLRFQPRQPPAAGAFQQGQRPLAGLSSPSSRAEGRARLTAPDAARARPGIQEAGRGAFDGGGFGGGGTFGTGRPGPLRLFTGPLSNEVSWLLPFGLFAGLLLAFRSRLHWPISPKHQAVVLWGGWLLTAAVFFSIAGFFHPYYLVMLAPPLAALVGLGVAELWQLHGQRWWLALALAAVTLGGTAAWQLLTATAYMGTVGWLPLVACLFGAGLALSALARNRWQGVAWAGFACLVGAILITPGVWSGLTTLYSTGSEPGAYSGQGTGRLGFGPGNGRAGLQIDQTLLAYLQAHTVGMKYLMAVPSSGQGAGYVIATGRPVLYLGGFDGQDQVETTGSMAALVADQVLRYVYEGGGPGGLAGRSGVAAWVANTCKVVQYEATSAQSAAGAGANGGVYGFFGGFRGGQRTLYDCQAN